MIQKIKIIGAKENNLKNISLDIDKHKFNVVTGVSGSGKSSLVFDCIYASAQSAFYETLSTYIVKNLPKINKPNVDNIYNLSPCVLIEQKKLGQNPRSTVGTYTEIFTYLRLLYSRIGRPSYDSSYFSFNTPKHLCPHFNTFLQQYEYLFIHSSSVHTSSSGPILLLFISLSQNLHFFANICFLYS